MTAPHSRLVISPHLDDGVLSLGPIISKWRRQGERVVVATVFSGRPTGPLSPAALEDAGRYGETDPVALRKGEDIDAAAILDFDIVHLDLPEVLFRNRPDGTSRVVSLADIFDSFNDDLDAEVVEAARVAIERMVRSNQPDEVLAPLGVGGHIDHAVVRRACAGLATRWYGDMPYALEDDVSAYAATEGVHPQNEPCDSADVELWLDAVAEYPSQVKIMFEGRDWRREFRDWIATSGGIALYGTG